MEDANNLITYGKFFYEWFRKPVLYATGIGLINTLIGIRSEMKELGLKLTIARGIQGEFTPNENPYSSH